MIRKVVMLELNEISRRAIDLLIQRGKCPHFAKINQEWHYYQTESESQYQHLEPWIQWVTVHTGKTFAEHEVFRLSDAHTLSASQTWEDLSGKGIESAIVGSMNVTRGNTQGGFFFPDPWAREGKVFPEQYQPLWDLISSKVQTHATKPLTKKDLWQAFQVCRQFKIPLSLYAKIAKQLIQQKINPRQRWRLAAWFDFLLSQIFVHLYRQTNYGFYTLFLNAVAHYQHHYWRQFDREGFDPHITVPDCDPQDDPMTFGYEMYDAILGKLIELTQQDPEVLVMVVSGLSQEPFLKKESEGGMNYYRLKDHQVFVKKLGLLNIRVLPMMSRDWQVESEDSVVLQKAKASLNQVMVEGEPLFAISENTPNSLFIETQITHYINPETPILYQGSSLGTFCSYFTRIAVKSGSHVGQGSVWFSRAIPEIVELSPGVISLTQLHGIILSSLMFQRTHEIN